MTRSSANPVGMFMADQTPRILLVDDDPEIARHVGRALERLGWESRTLDRDEDVLDVVADWQPSHIMLDLVMPGENGISLTQRLAEAEVRASIIFSSGADRRIMEAVARSARLHGLTVAGLLPKPFTRSKLAEALGRAVMPAGDTSGPSAESDNILEIDPIELESAIKRGDIRPWLQPQVACDSGAIVGFEVLARWHHAHHGIIGPSVFIPTAETHGLIERLTLALVSQALHWLGANAAHASATMSFNVTPSLLEEGDFVQKLLRACARYGVDPARVVLEVTESTRLKQDVATLDRLTLLRLDGLRLSIDDFGIGYSSLLQLAHLPFSEIKVDRSFVSMATRSDEARAIATSIISLARQLGMTSVAEGVEDKATFDLLREAGCNRIQGYYFSRPLSLKEANNVRSQFDVT
ncbi:EAL domain-containing response regulator [Devosia chinhatensis]|uniref:EAL domain-containing response regulator n=1 Tax=Devosia chinhatensis TaxID=429727 RepID=UPI000696DB37|nr:EAL domain-containing response regulator [Devosia chinhatensis]